MQKTEQRGQRVCDGRGWEALAASAPLCLPLCCRSEALAICPLCEEQSLLGSPLICDSWRAETLVRALLLSST